MQTSKTTVLIRSPMTTVAVSEKLKTTVHVDGEARNVKGDLDTC